LRQFLRSFISVLKTIEAEALKFYYDVRRYLFNYLVGIVSTTIFLSGIYYGLRLLYARAGEETAFVGLLLWIFSSSAISGLADILAEERYLGTLERISVTKSSFISIVVSRLIVNFLFGLLQFVIIGSILYLLFRPNLAPLFLSSKVFFMQFIVSIFLLLSLYGFGFFIGSLSLIFKRVVAFSSVLEYLILFFSGIVIPWEKIPFLLRVFSNFLPMTWGIRTLILIKMGEPFLFSFLNCVLYTFVILIAGISMFHYAMILVKKRGEYAFFLKLYAFFWSLCTNVFKSPCVK